MTRQSSIGAIIIAVVGFASGIMWNQSQDDFTHSDSQVVSAVDSHDGSGPAAILDREPILDLETPSDIGRVHIDDLDDNQQFFPGAIADVPNDVRNEEVRAASIDKSPSELTEPEREVWNDSLSGRSEKERAEILAIRNQVGSIATPLFPSLDTTAASGSSDDVNSVATNHARPIEPGKILLPKDGSLIELNVGSSQPRQIDSAVRLVTAVAETSELINAANRLYKEDLLNQQTIGFKRRELIITSPLTVDDFGRTRLVANIPGLDDSETATTKPTKTTLDKWHLRLDLLPGSYRETGNSLDIAIQGKGWLQVSISDTELGYTRAGVLAVDKQHQLCVRTNGGLLALSPRVIVSENNAIEIDKLGTVSTKNSEGNLAECGRISIFGFRDATQLQRLPSGCYSTNAQTGEAFEVKCRLGDEETSIMPQHVEISNSQVDKAQEKLKQLEELAASLN
jgi:flagellar basal body rod protein FlgG